MSLATTASTLGRSRTSARGRAAAMPWRGSGKSPPARRRSGRFVTFDFQSISPQSLMVTVWLGVPSSVPAASISLRTQQTTGL